MTFLLLFGYWSVITKYIAIKIWHLWYAGRKKKMQSEQRQKKITPSDRGGHVFYCNAIQFKFPLNSDFWSLYLIFFKTKKHILQCKHYMWTQVVVLLYWTIVYKKMLKLFSPPPVWSDSGDKLYKSLLS